SSNVTRSIVLYSGQHPQLTQSLVSAFEKKTGINVKVRYNDGVILADQLLQEGQASPADVFLTENSPELMLLEDKKMLARLPMKILNQIPPDYSSPSGDWVGVALRISCLAYNPSMISASQLPSSILNLSSDAWKNRVAIAPTDSDFVPLVGAVVAKYGKREALSWLAGLKRNGSIYQDDESVVSAVNRGAVAVGIVNQYYWYRLRLQEGSAAMHSTLYYFGSNDAGSIENISGVGIIESSTKKNLSEQFVSFLVSKQGQQILSKSDDFEYPARSGVAPNSALVPISRINPASVSVIQLGDDRQAAALIQQSGLT
ncbi:MAG TPA: extracellular solute-binding protein, partial [Acidimicrobiales bacterium]|nr:extracellular solute-binding protein [Acidimicrobiales bacterium]